MKKLKSERPDIVVEQFKLAATGLLEFHPCSPEFDFCIRGVIAYKNLAEFKAQEAAQNEEDEDEDCEACNS